MKPALRIPWLDARFGTWRGAVRLALAYPEMLLGLATADRTTVADAKRLVFVCQGNICRSAFADVVARRRGLAVASFGLATTTGLPANAQAHATAAALGYDLSAHRTLASADYEPRPGDLLLVMETRQLRKLAADPRLRHVPRALLGLWARPRVPHLHDPFELEPAYFERCFRRIERAVDELAAVVSARSVSGS